LNAALGRITLVRSGPSGRRETGINSKRPDRTDFEKPHSMARGVVNSSNGPHVDKPERRRDRH